VCSPPNDTSVTSFEMPGSKRTAVPPEYPAVVEGRRPIEFHRFVDLEEV